jgi:hypothetical protein
LSGQNSFGLKSLSLEPVRTRFDVEADTEQRYKKCHLVVEADTWQRYKKYHLDVQADTEQR